MTRCIGLTGNIASGKSTVAGIFSDLGIDVLSADAVAKELTNQNTPAYNAIVTHFGPEALLVNKDLNRTYLRGIIFSHPQEKKWLENLLHPLIRNQLEQKVNNCTTPYCILEIPLLTDKTLYPYLDRVLVITAPLELQIERVMQRDNCTREHALAILSAQPAPSERLRIADDVIINDSDYEQLKQAVNQLHIHYLSAPLSIATSADK
ncbi:dephospho-CoA kinase [Legionella worsleiensis]|uniref:Dephospho-CoA kinase n=1 Tax=Legionella worsleiensis TaxID=45076 RepID=A0A0W1A6B4_9GAMM|nr:dephospho-CoA kinase [Legionella worsleiensis]KTD76874.1 dephospho-CoA kinase [Legionella worsleiensis]STY33456.1 dephospho-CoA kinase [Legionella worsleiensis]